ncbi:MAG: hypothetical protein PVJ76_18545 [Gemmatimonadota bacterium]
MRGFDLRRTVFRISPGLFWGCLAALLLVGASSCHLHCDGSLEVVSVTRAGVAYAVELDGNAAYVTNNDGVLIFDIRDPGNPALIGEAPTGVTFDISVRNGLAFVVGEDGFSIVDVSDPTHPRVVSTYNLEGIGWAVRIDGSTAVVGTNEGLEVLDVTNLGAPRRVGFLDLDGDVMGLALREGLGFIGGYFQGLRVIDLRAPADPRQVAALGAISGAESLDLHGDTLFIASHHHGIRIVDVADPLEPRLLGEFVDDDGGEALALTAQGTDLFVADNFQIEWIDVGDPSRAFQIGECGRTNGAHDIEFDGSLVYVAEGTRGLIVLRPTEGAGR